MRFLKPRQLKAAFLRIKSENASMRRRFVVYMLSALCAVISFALLLLNLFGGLNFASDRLEQALDYQLDSSATVLREDIDALAAYATVFSDQMSSLLDKTLSDAGLSFDDLRDNQDVLTDLQSEAYLTVYNNMRIAPCSGAFYFLNTTVNSGLEQGYYNGIYLKVANLFSENTIHSKACLYRGAVAVARENDVNLHSTWQNELLTGTFLEIDHMMGGTVERLSDSCLLTPVYELPDTWERARFLCVPILDGQGNTVGVCGYEISDLFFKLSYKTGNMEQAYLVCALLDKGADGYTGQISGSQSGYAPPIEDVFLLEEGKRLTTIRCGEMTFYGKVRDITIGKTTHTLAVMLPKAQYDSSIQDGQMKTWGILLIILGATIGVCLWFSKRYVSPILKGLEQIKSADRAGAQSSVPEINDLFAFLAEQDRLHEDSLTALEQEKQVAQSEKDQLELEYQQARLVYEKAQSDYVLAQEELADAKKELDRLAYSRKSEIDPDDYQHFLAGIQKLTKTERNIFGWYLDGMSAKEILAMTGIMESTLKYHNRNILSKLGVSSRKQMLRYAALMKQQEQGGITT